jgi:serine/threonine-protein kinase SRPK3
MSSISNSSIYSTESLSGLDTDSESYKTNIDLHGDIINNYNVITKLGSGSFSNVWLVFSIKDNNFYALKVQNYDDYDEGKDEVIFLKKLKNHKYINNLIDCFTEKKFINNKIEKLICSVYNICCMNLHHLLKIKKYSNGLPYDMVVRIYNQICEGLAFLHNDVKVFHGDIKPDNILICGINKRNQYYINKYKEKNFSKLYLEVKKKYWIDKGKQIENIKKMPLDLKIKIRKQVHSSIINSIEKTTYTNLDVDDSYFYNNDICNINIKISDFGSHCSDEEKMEELFGTQYYMAPEILLMSDCTKSVDIWALGCTLYELCTNKLLFNPHGDTTRETDQNHLELIHILCNIYPKYIFNNGKRYNVFFKKGKLRNTSNNNLKDLKDLKDLKKLLNDKLLDSEYKEKIKKLISEMIQINPSSRKKISECKICIN